MLYFILRSAEVFRMGRWSPSRIRTMDPRLQDLQDQLPEFLSEGQGGQY